MHDENIKYVAYQHYRIEIAQGFVWHFLQQRQDPYAFAPHQEAIAIGCGVWQIDPMEYSRPIVHDHLLAPGSSQPLRDYARGDVVAAADAGGDHAYGLVWIILAQHHAPRCSHYGDQPSAGHKT